MEENKDMMNSDQEQVANEQKFENTELPKIEVNEEASTETSKETEKSQEINLEVESNDSDKIDEEVAASNEPTKEVKEEVKTDVIPDFNKLTIEELVAETNKVVNTYEFGKSKKLIDIIKNTFYSKLNKEQEEHKKKFLDDGGKIEEYTPLVNSNEETFKELIRVFKIKRAESVSKLEQVKEANYKQKLEIIEQITQLVNSTEHFNTVYNTFKELQAKWKNIKQIPSSKIKELNSKYHFALNQFYDYLNINKELRELDLKKNQQQKETLCQRAEDLIDSKNAKTAFVELQDLHQRWKDVGPVIDEYREALWERFKTATKAINDKFQDYQTKLKEDREVNLVKKTEVCEKVEAVLKEDYTTPKEWDESSNIVIELQKEWRKIGMVPSKYNDDIYSRFKSVCDAFFKKKNEFFNGLKSKQKDNLDLKIVLIEKVEAFKDSEDWVGTSNKIIQIQKQWKNIGPVPRKKSDAVWKRFRSACDIFFNNKDAHFKEIHGDEKENLEKKNELIKLIDAYQQKEDGKESVLDLKTFQDQWAGIGFVPIKNKNDVQERYRTAINNQFDALNIDVKERDLARLKVKLDQYIESPNAQKLIFGERNKLVTRIKKVESDIQQLENNIGFFSAGTAKGLLKEYENKIEVNKKNLEVLKGKIKLIDSYIE